MKQNNRILKEYEKKSESLMKRQTFMFKEKTKHGQKNFKETNIIR